MQQQEAVKSKHLARSKHLASGTVNGNCHFWFKLSFLVCISLALFCASHDPGIAKNPGPSRQPFPYTSNREKELFLKIHGQYEDIVKTESHNNFLEKCLANKVIPEGLITDFTNATAKPDINLSYNLDILRNNNSFNTVKAIISQYKIQLFRLN